MRSNSYNENEALCSSSSPRFKSGIIPNTEVPELP